MYAVHPSMKALKELTNLQWGSGPCVLQAFHSKKIKLIGFDLYSPTNKINNIYKDTDNYDRSDKDAIDPRYWIYQIGKVFSVFPKKYKIYNTHDWNLPGMATFHCSR